jgi:hypothetical protein
MSLRGSWGHTSFFNVRKMSGWDRGKREEDCIDSPWHPKIWVYKGQWVGTYEVVGVEPGTDEEELGLEGTQLGEDLTLVGLTDNKRGHTMQFNFSAWRLDEYCTVLGTELIPSLTDALFVDCGHTHPLPLSLGKAVAYHAEGVGARVMWEWDVDDIARHTLLSSMACARVVPLTCMEDTDRSRQSPQREREVSSCMDDVQQFCVYRHT